VGYSKLIKLSATFGDEFNILLAGSLAVIGLFCGFVLGATG
jgi:hypothetical protein